jgi:hypothetical protein
LLKKLGVEVRIDRKTNPHRDHGFAVVVTAENLRRGEFNVILLINRRLKAQPVSTDDKMMSEFAIVILVAAPNLQTAAWSD